VVDIVALGQAFSKYFGFPCQPFVPLIAPQSSPSIVQGWYNRPINGGSNSGLGSTSPPEINKQIIKKVKNFFTVESHKLLMKNYGVDMICEFEVIYCSACVLQSILHQDWSSDSAKGILI
jgi:hypothetical protein